MESNASPAPRVSLLVLVYNQESTVRNAVESCLAQDCEPVEIVLSDDASSDRSFEIMQEMAAAYRGPHTVIARRNARNLGIGDHYNELVKASRGQLLFTAAGDDWSVPDRLRTQIAAWDATGGQVDLIASHVIDLDHQGRLHEVMRVEDLSKWKTVAQWAEKRPYIIGAGHAFTRRMMERFGPMKPAIFYEDQIMVFRAIALGGAITVDRPLVHYRRGGTSRKPIFESTEHMVKWTDRQRGREQAEMQQLIADADQVGVGDIVRAKLSVPLARISYLLSMRHTKNFEERKAVFRQAAILPVWWRTRKMLHVAFPEATFAIKSVLVRFHSRARRDHDQAVSKGLK